MSFLSEESSELAPAAITTGKRAASVIGTTSVFGTDYPTYRLFIIGVAALLALALVLWLSRSRTGLYIRAASHDTETSSILAVNTDPDAPILASADYAVIGDLHEVVPAISAELREAQQRKAERQ